MLMLKVAVQRKFWGIVIGAGNALLRAGGVK